MDYQPVPARIRLACTPGLALLILVRAPMGPRGPPGMAVKVVLATV
jgi:hypothetical protein